jgi:hypothetical protein
MSTASSLGDALLPLLHGSRDSPARTHARARTHALPCDCSGSGTHPESCQAPWHCPAVLCPARSSGQPRPHGRPVGAAAAGGSGGDAERARQRHGPGGAAAFDNSTKQDACLYIRLFSAAAFQAATDRRATACARDLFLWLVRATSCPGFVRGGARRPEPSPRADQHRASRERGTDGRRDGRTDGRTRARPARREA